MRPTVRPDDTRPTDNTPRPTDPRRDEQPLYPKLTEKQKLEQLRKQTQNYPKWDAARYQRAVSGTFDALVSTNDDYMSVINGAAAQNKPVVMLIGSGSDPASRQVIENSLKQARDANGKDAVYAFVDLDRVDRNSSIGKYALENMPRNGMEPPFTMVFGMSRSNDSRNPVVADAPRFYTMGAPETARLNEAVSRAKLEMAGRFTNLPRPDQFPNPTVRPDQAPNPTVRPDQTFPRPDTQPRPDTSVIDKRVAENIAMALVQAQRQTDREQSYNFYKQAVDLADSTKNPLLQAATRTELGIACLNWGFKETGYKWIMDGASKNPEFFNDQKNQDYRTRLLESGVPQGSLNYMLENGRRDPIWHTKDRDAAKKVEAAGTQFVPQTRPTPQINPNPFNIPLDTKPNPTAPKPPVTHLTPSPFGPRR